MNRTNHPHRSALAAFLSATALVATPVFAQEATPVVPPPAAAPVTVTPPPAEPVAAVPAPAQQTGTSPTPVNPEAAAAAEAEDAARPTRAAVRPATRQPATRVERPRAPAASAPTPAPAAVAPEPIPTPSPSPSATATPATPATPEVTPTPVAAETARPAAPAPAPTGGSSAWPWLLVGLAVLAAAFFFLRRRRDTADVEPEYVEPAYVEPAHVAPLAATPTMLDRTPAATRDETVTVPAVDETATVTDATGEDVAALTAAAPVGDRPWLEFAMRPIRAGTNADEAIVEIELTVGNAGRVAAHDVRISTFMLDEGDRSEMERLLVTPPAGAGVEPVTIDPGEGTRIDATLGLLKSSLSSAEFRPIVVADARYRMADGTEGRTSASFRIGVTEAGTTALSPIDTARPLMREDIEARLFRDPEHA